MSDRRAQTPDPSPGRPHDWRSPQLTYGLTPPKLSYPAERRRKTALAQTKRIATLPVDALIVYDLQDESSRTDVKRPFPFLQTIDPLEYAYDDLADVPHPRIVYHSVAGSSASELADWLGRLGDHGGSAVLVGAPSRRQPVRLGLREAYRIAREQFPNVPLGGVLIAERHASAGNEVDRVLRKEANGCSFFVSQAVYSVSASKDLLSDLHYTCARLRRPAPPVLVTLSPCGSQKTLEFMNWLGVSVPRWLENELIHARDILGRSVGLALDVFEELHAFALEKGLRLGCNVESVSLHRDEIDASVEMVGRAARLLGRLDATAPPVEARESP